MILRFLSDRTPRTQTPEYSIRQFAPDIMVGDAQVIPIFMPPGKDVEVSSTPTDLSFVQPGTLLQQRKFSDPLLPAGTMPESA